eukprot:TRINITY_DN10771_c0_g4_i4.p1 TRINITY_DN10771_c0_g4~~TRINITY_DN10771_c0_g4_i4.p1  ORF type:complete len:856 (-),score=212.27 TRINITY_DN10771_c0_g4_i4:193-2760(-)
MDLAKQIKKLCSSPKDLFFSLIFAYTICALTQSCTQFPLLTAFDGVLVIATISACLHDMLNSASEFYKAHPQLLVLINAFFLFIMLGYDLLDCFKTNCFILFLVTRLYFKKSITQNPTHHCLKHEANDSPLQSGQSLIRKRSLSDLLSNDEQWMDLLDHGYFLCGKDMNLIYANKKGYQLINEQEMSFAEFIENLVESGKSLRVLMEEMDREKDGVIRAELSPLAKSKDKTMIAGEFLSNYKAKVWKLSPDYTLIMLKQKDQLSTQILGKKLGVATVSTLSHELKTLLNAVMGNLELMETTVDKKHMLFYRYARSSSHVLSCRLDDLFDYIQIKEEVFEMRCETLLVAELVGDVAEVCKWLAKQKHLELQAVVKENVPANITGDRTRLRQVLLNLMTKVIEYTEYGKIVLQVKMNNKNKLVFQVKSVGTGMHRALLAQMKHFSPKRKKEHYKNSENAPEKATENMEEMYLEIAHLISRAIGAKILVKSAERKSSQFSFELPLHSRELPAHSPSNTFEDAFLKAVGKKDSSKLCVENVKDASDAEIPNECELPVHITLCKYSFDSNIIMSPGRRYGSLYTSSSINLRTNRRCEDFSRLVPRKIQNDRLERLKNSRLLKAMRKQSEKNVMRQILEKELIGELDSKMHKKQKSAIDPGNNLMDISEDDIKDQPIKEQTEESNTFLKKEVPKAAKNVHKRKRRTTVQFNPYFFAKQSARKGCVEGLGSCNILIVDDNAANRFVLKALLQKRDYNSIEAQDGADAVEVVRRYIKTGTIRQLLLILMDLQMPVMNGIESTRCIIKLCEEAEAEVMPIVGVSSNSLEEDRRKFEQAGISEFISKPLDKEKIDRIIRKYIEKT